MNDRRSEQELQTTAPESTKLGAGRVIVRIVLPLVVIGIGWVGYQKLSVEPEREKRPPGKPRALKTRVLPLKVEDYQTVIRTQGIVSPHNEISLTAQVSGQVIRLSPSFEDGAFFSKGEVLVEIDPAVYMAGLKGAQAQLAQAKAGHAQETARAKQARLNWNDLGYDDEPNELVLRLPQLREAEARVDSAAAQLERAQRDVNLTKITAPFDGRVRRRQVGVSQAIGAGTPLGTIFAIDYAEVRLPIAARDMVHLNLPESPEDPAVDVELGDALTLENEAVWKAKIIRTEGALDASSLDLFAIARIDDPFGRVTKRAPLRIGQPVTASIPGKVLKEVISIPREAVKQLSKIQLVDQDAFTLSKRTIAPIWRAEDHVVIRDPTIKDGTLLATGHLVYAPLGAKVEIIPEVSEEQTDEVSGENS